MGKGAADFQVAYFGDGYIFLTNEEGKIYKGYLRAISANIIKVPLRLMGFSLRGKKLQQRRKT